MIEHHHGEQSISVRRQGGQVVLTLAPDAAAILAEFLDHRDPRYATSWQRVGAAVQSAAHGVGVFSEPLLSRSQFLRVRWLTEVPPMTDLSLPLMPLGSQATEPPASTGASPSDADESSSVGSPGRTDQATAIAEAELNTFEAALLVRAAVVIAAATTAEAARSSKVARAEEATRAAAAVAAVVSRAAAAVQSDADQHAEAVAALASSAAAAVALRVTPGHEVEERQKAAAVAANTAREAVETARITALAAARVAEAAAEAARAAAAAASDAAVILELEVADAAQAMQCVTDQAAHHVSEVSASTADLVSMWS